MISFKRIHIQDFMSVGEIEFEFKPTLGLLLGMNLDSMGADDNGAGKSSIGEALRWCLFGETVRSVIDKSLPVEHVLRNGAKRASVTLKFACDGVDYTVTRTRTKNKGELYVEGGGSPHEGRAAQSVLGAVLGINVVQFANLVHLDGSYPKLFAPTTDRDRKEILADLVDVAIAEDMRRHAAAACSAVEDQLAWHDTEQMKRDFVIERAKEDIVTHKDRGKKFKKELEEVKAGVTEAHAEIVRWKAKLEAVEEEQKKTVKTQGDELDDLTRDLAAVTNQIEQKRIQVENLSDFYLVNDIVAYTEELHLVEAKVNNISTRVNEMEDLRALGKCPTCSQDTTEVGAGDIASLTSQAEGLKDEVQRLEGVLEALEQERADKLKEARRDLREQEQYERTIRQRFNRLHTAEQAAGKALRDKFKEIDSQWRAACEKHSELCAKRNALVDSITNAKRGWEDAQQQITDAKKQSEDSSEEYNVLLQSKEDWEFWKKGFGPRGVPSLFIETVLPSISSRIQRYADILTGGDVLVKLTAYRETKSKTVQEAIQISAVNSKGASVYGSNSTGERNRINMAVTLGLIDYFKDMGVFESDLLVCDEIFDGLDSTGVEQALLALKEANIPSVLVISHHDHFKPLFSDTMYVKKEGGVSSLGA